MSAALVTVKLEADFGAGFVDITTDVRSAGHPIELSYGIQGGGPGDRVASTGTLRFALNNSNKNSGGLLGYYSLNNANKRSGFALGMKVRFSVATGGTTYYKFYGKLDDASAVPGAHGERATLCVAVDWMDEAAKYKLVGLPTVLGTNAGAVMNQILAAAPVAPNATAISTGTDIYPYAMANQPTEVVYALSEFQRLATTELGLVLIRGGTTTGTVGTLTFYSRVDLVKSPLNASQATFADSTIAGMETRTGRETVLNVFRMIAHPRSYDPTSVDPVVLYQFTGTTKPSVDPGKTITLLGKYVDPAQQAARVGGYSMVTPVNGTDYSLNSNPDGSGTDLSGSVSLSAAYGSDGVQYTITNSGGTTAYVAKLQARGYGIYDYQPTVMESRDSASVTANGEHAADLDMWYLADPLAAKLAGDYLLPFWKDAATVAASISFPASASSALMTQACSREPGDVITVQETVTGLNKLFRIICVRLSISDGSLVGCTWELNPMVDTTAYWIWDTSVWDTGKWYL